MCGFFFFFFFFFFFGWAYSACGILVSWLGIKPGVSAVKVQSLSHWTTRGIPSKPFFIPLCIPKLWGGVVGRGGDKKKWGVTASISIPLFWYSTFLPRSPLRLLFLFWERRMRTPGCLGGLDFLKISHFSWKSNIAPKLISYKFKAVVPTFPKQ